MPVRGEAGGLFKRYRVSGRRGPMALVSGPAMVDVHRQVWLSMRRSQPRKMYGMFFARDDDPKPMGSLLLTGGSVHPHDEYMPHGPARAPSARRPC